jgi:hypothetical protein
MEAALCAWEQMMEWRFNPAQQAEVEKEPEKFLAHQIHMNEQWEGIGYAGMRSVATQAGSIALAVYDLMESQGAEFNCAYDWEFIPAVLALLDWKALCDDNQYGAAAYKPNISVILKDMMETMADDFDATPKKSAWLAQARYAAQKLFAYSDLISDHEDRADAAFEADEDPAEFAEWLGDKYDLTRVHAY